MNFTFLLPSFALNTAYYKYTANNTTNTPTSIVYRECFLLLWDLAFSKHTSCMYHFIILTYAVEAHSYFFSRLLSKYFSSLRLTHHRCRDCIMALL